MSVLLPHDYEGLRDTLKQADLPHDEADLAKAEFFRFVTDDGGLLGYGGFETYGPDGLLRSVVILESFRGWGFGLQFVKVLESLAKFNGISKLWLLTTTAEEFFVKCGYEKVERAAAPAAIKAANEFSGVCPDTAVCLTKAL